MFFQKSDCEKLREQEDIILRLFPSGDNIQEIKEYYDIYLKRMNESIGDTKSQLLWATIFTGYLKTFVIGETKHLSDEQISDIRFAAKTMLINTKNYE